MYGSLGSHLSANGTECYITSDMFYVEVQLDPTGLLCDVKVAHHGENPVVCITGQGEGDVCVVLTPFALSTGNGLCLMFPYTYLTPLVLVLVEREILRGVIQVG